MRFFHDERGGVAIFFSAAALAVFGFVGVAVDYARLNTARDELRHALDAAALAGGQLSSGDRATVARKVFDVNFKHTDLISSFTAYVAATTPQEIFRAEATIRLPATISRVVGFADFPVSAKSDVVRGNDANLEIALALDVTYSMTGSRLTALKAASTDMINTMFDSLKRQDQVKFSIVPFSRYVNVGKANRTKDWMSVPDDYSVTTYSCSKTKPVTRTYDCVTKTTTKYNDGVPYQSTSTTCKYEYGPEVETCSNKTTNYKWNGCAGSRAFPLDTLDAQYTTKIPGILNVSCPQQLTPLTSDRAALVKSIQSLAVADETYLPPGLIWGWRTLSSGEPFDDAADPTRITNRYLILMTDGVNTLSPNYPTHNGTNRTLADKLTSDICRNAKDSGIIIYSIAFEVTDLAAKSMLQTCASAPDKFFDAANADQLSGTFKSIASQLLALRIAK